MTNTPAELRSLARHLDWIANTQEQYGISDVDMTKARAAANDDADGILGYLNEVLGVEC